jgi:hypothetical protein
MDGSGDLNRDDKKPGIAGLSFCFCESAASF